MTDARRVPGRFVWCDLMATDPEAARRFYGALFPVWQLGARDEPEAGFQRISLSGRTIGSFVDLNPAYGLPSHWVPYLTVRSVDEACAHAKELGGKVHSPPMEMAGLGRFAVLGDPQGAVFSPIEPAEETPEHNGPMPAGAFCWLELLTTDAASAAAFYAKVLGWSHAEVPMGGAPYHLFRRGERDAAGMVQMPAGAEEKPGWLAYVYTSDMDASVARVTELGGRVWRAVAHVPGVGQFAVAADPNGAKVALFRSERG